MASFFCGCIGGLIWGGEVYLKGVEMDTKRGLGAFRKIEGYIIKFAVRREVGGKI